MMGKLRELKVDDLIIKTIRTPWRKGQSTRLCGISTRKYYESSNPRYRISAIEKKTFVSFAELALYFYNIKEDTKFGQVKVRKVIRAMGGRFDNHITFKAYSPSGVSSVFITKIREYFVPYHKIEIMYVGIKNSNRDYISGDNELQPVVQLRALSDDCLKDLAPYLSLYALVIYNIFKLGVKKVAVHDFSSLKVVRAVKQDLEGTSLLVTFQASSRETRNVETRNVETFEAQICVPSLSPAVIFELKEIQIKEA